MAMATQCSYVGQAASDWRWSAGLQVRGEDGTVSADSGLMVRLTGGRTSNRMRQGGLSTTKRSTLQHGEVRPSRTISEAKQLFHSSHSCPSQCIESWVLSARKSEGSVLPSLHNESSLCFLTVNKSNDNKQWKEVCVPHGSAEMLQSSVVCHSLVSRLLSPATKRSHSLSLSALPGRCRWAHLLESTSGTQSRCSVISGSNTLFFAGMSHMSALSRASAATTPPQGQAGAYAFGDANSSSHDVDVKSGKDNFVSNRFSRESAKIPDGDAWQQQTKKLPKVKLAVFVSGGGSNLRTLHASILGDKINGEVAMVVSDKPGCGGCEYARQHGIPVVTFPRSKAAPDGVSPNELVTELLNLGVKSVLLAGYLKLIPAELVRAFPRAVLNIHPALLPAFGGKGYFGMRVHEAVVKSGVRVSGATIHFIDEEYDTGPIVAQRVVPVYPTDSAHDVAQRVLKVEHELYPWVVAALCEGRIVWGETGQPMVRKSWDEPNSLL